MLKQSLEKIAEAYEILSDENKRKEYDRFGHDSFTSGRKRGGNEKKLPHQHFNFDDLFRDFEFFRGEPKQ
ncbi:unnamed protein product [Ranitomeya imitator]|uniref:DnaJ homolog subfamily B member 9 n=1 Tax=Ranitomeya imitator TaxID=111125 RepID=A0ABN9LLD0_9NEOB|nr:unnamed protein product [Ranitomeya imitator]